MQCSEEDPLGVSSALERGGKGILAKWWALPSRCLIEKGCLHGVMNDKHNGVILAEEMMLPTF